MGGGGFIRAQIARLREMPSPFFTLPTRLVFSRMPESSLRVYCNAARCITLWRVHLGRKRFVSRLRKTGVSNGTTKKRLKPHAGEIHDPRRKGLLPPLFNIHVTKPAFCLSFRGMTFPRWLHSSWLADCRRCNLLRGSGNEFLTFRGDARRYFLRFRWEDAMGNHERPPRGAEGGEKKK